MTWTCIWCGLSHNGADQHSIIECRDRMAKELHESNRLKDEATALLKRCHDLYAKDVADTFDHPEFCDCNRCHHWASVRAFLNPSTTERPKELPSYVLCSKCGMQQHFGPCDTGTPLKRNDEAEKCGVCGAEIKGNFSFLKAAWDDECEWYLCRECYPKHTH